MFSLHTAKLFALLTKKKSDFFLKFFVFSKLYAIAHDLTQEP